MEFRLRCEKPEEIVYTITATMTAKEWEEIRESLDASKAPHWHPAGKLINAITDVLAQARKIYWPNSPDSAGGSNGR